MIDLHSAAVPSVLKTEEEAMQTVAVTPMQRRLLLQHQLLPKDGSFNLAYAFRIERDSVDLPRLACCFRQVLDACIGLNTSFHAGPEGPVALVRSSGHGPSLSELGDHPDVDGEQGEVIGWLAERADLPIPPDRWPLYDFTLHVGKNAVYLTMLSSHLVGDAYTYYNLIEKVKQLYADAGILEPHRARIGSASGAGDDRGHRVRGRPGGQHLPQSAVGGVRARSPGAGRGPDEARGSAGGFAEDPAARRAGHRSQGRRSDQAARTVRCLPRDVRGGSRAADRPCGRRRGRAAGQPSQGPGTSGLRLFRQHPADAAEPGGPQDVRGPRRHRGGSGVHPAAAPAVRPGERTPTRSSAAHRRDPSQWTTPSPFTSSGLRRSSTAAKPRRSPFPAH